MYVWIGFDVDSQLKELKRKSLEAEAQAQFRVQGSTLPLHISLKMPFEAADASCPRILDALEGFFMGLSPFTVPVAGLENEHAIAWLRMGESGELDRIHHALDDLLQREFGIVRHEYDTHYKFHVTLFLDPDPQKNDLAFSLIRDASLPGRLNVRRVCFGVSPHGGPGTYRMVRSLPLEDRAGDADRNTSL